MDHQLTDMEAARAYCGCSGVTVINGELKYSKFESWMKGYGLKSGNAEVGRKRRAEIEGYVYGEVAKEFWDCAPNCK